MSTFEIIDGRAVDPARLHAAFTAAFADYLIGPFRLPLAQWPQFLARQGVDLERSRVAVHAVAPVAFCLCAPRPECGSWRLGTMGAVPMARGTGAAAALLEDFVARARQASVAIMELECFAQNARAVRLYEAHGFQAIDALYGYQAITPPAPSASQAPPAIALEDAFDWLDQCSVDGCELPLQVTPRSLRTLPVHLQAWRRGSAQLVFSEESGAGIHVHSLVDRDPGQQAARELVGMLLDAYPERSVRVPQLQRQAVGGSALEQAGFTRLPLHQLWMKRVP